MSAAAVRVSEQLFDTEQAVLSAVFIEPSRIADVRALLLPGDFTDGRHQRLFHAMLTLDARGAVVDPLTLADELAHSGALEGAGGKDYIGFLMDAVPTAANIGYHAGIISRDVQRRKVIARLEADLAELKRTDDAAPIVAALGRELATLETLAASATLEHWPLGELLAHPAALKAPDVVIPRLAWRERVTLLSAREKVGKSTIMAHGAAKVSCGLPFLGTATAPAVVLWVYYEGHHADVARTLADAGAERTRVVVARGQPGAFAPLLALIRDVQPVVTIIDTLASFAAGSLVTEFSKAEQWTPVMNRFTRAAQELHTAFVLIHHDKKSGGYADSRAIGAGADMLLNIPGEPGDPSPRRQITGVGRWSYTGCTVRLEQGEFVLDDEGTPSIELEVLDVIRKHPGCSKRAVREATGRAREETDKAIARLLSQQIIENRERGGTHAYYVASATLSATPVASVAGLGGQGLTPSPATRVAGGAPPLGGATATLGGDSETNDEQSDLVEWLYSTSANGRHP